jgi:hypothetical protein
LRRTIGSNSFTLQTDCVQVVDTMMNRDFLATASVTIYDGCNILSNGFDNVNLEYCNREANQVVHELAKNAFISNNSCIWINEPLSFLLSKLVNDITMLFDQ